MSSSVYFDLKVSNGINAKLSARKVSPGTWGYEITYPKAAGKPTPGFRGTVTWNVDDEEEGVVVEYLYLIHLILADYYPKVCMA